MKHALPFALVLALAACQSTEPAPAPAEAPGPEEMMARMEQLAAPGPEHARLDDLVGTFDAAVKIWMVPGAPPEESTGTMVNEWILGGRYVRGEYLGSFQGSEFTGVSIIGFDNATQSYQGTWLDSMTTAILPVSHGVREASVITMEREMLDPMSGNMVSERDVFRIESRDRHTMEMYVGTPDGGEMKSMEIVYTRRR